MTRTWRRLCPPVAAAPGAAALVTEPRTGEIMMSVAGPAGDGELWTWSADRFVLTAAGFFGTRVDSVTAAVDPEGTLVLNGKGTDGLVSVRADAGLVADGTRARLVAVDTDDRLRALLDGHPWSLPSLGADWAATASGSALRVVLAGDSPSVRVLGRDGHWTAHALRFDPELAPDGDDRDDWGAPDWVADLRGDHYAEPEETAHYAPLPDDGVMVLDRHGHTWLLDEAGTGQKTLAPSEAALAGLRPDSREGSDLVRMAAGTERAVIWHGRTGRAWTLFLGYSPRIIPRWQLIRGDGPRAGAAALCVSGAGTFLFAEGELWLLKRHGWQWLGGQKDWTARSLFVHDGGVWSVGAEAVGRWNGAAFEVVAALPVGAADFLHDPASGRLLAVGAALGTSGLTLP